MSRILDPAGATGTQTRDVFGSIPASDSVVVSSDHAVTDVEATVMVKTMRQAVTITLPRAAVHNGRQISIRKIDAGANPVTIVAQGGEPLDGQSALGLTAAGEFVSLVSDGSAWAVVVHF
jgi:hypothetical protein